MSWRLGPERERARKREREREIEREREGAKEKRYSGVRFAVLVFVLPKVENRPRPTLRTNDAKKTECLNPKHYIVCSNPATVRY